MFQLQETDWFFMLIDIAQYYHTRAKDRHIPCTFNLTDVAKNISSRRCCFDSFFHALVKLHQSIFKEVLCGHCIRS